MSKSKVGGRIFDPDNSAVFEYHELGEDIHAVQLALTGIKKNSEHDGCKRMKAKLLVMKLELEKKRTATLKIVNEIDAQNKK